MQNFRRVAETRATFYSESRDTRWRILPHLTATVEDTLTEEELSCAKRADFLLNKRRIVLEIKSLKVDSKYKVEERLRPHRDGWWLRGVRV